MKYYLIAGEASGDLHGANLLKGILKHDSQAEFRFWGGDAMASVGGESSLAKHYKEASFFGISEIIMNLRTIFAQIKECKKDVLDFKPDVLILIDYPGFNFRMAKFAHLKGIKTFYYISPKVWAWKESRVKLIRKYVDKLFIIFPFEREYFAQRGIDAIYKGNPLVDAVSEKLEVLPSCKDFRAKWNLSEDKPLVALLSGSRGSEINYNLPFMVELSREFEGYEFVVAGVSWLDKQLYDKYLEGSRVKFICNDTQALVKYSDAAVVTSGTATLETAIIGTPELVCYRTSALTANIAKLVLKIKYISLVNIIMDAPVVRELIQWDMTLENAKDELRAILPGGEKHDKMMQDFELLREQMGERGASERFAEAMVEILKS
ncbi:MAG: lipid-A-disaccharide synthase [Rikenellaceae bacterium]